MRSWDTQGSQSRAWQLGAQGLVGSGMLVSEQVNSLTMMVWPAVGSSASQPVTSISSPVGQGYFSKGASNACWSGLLWAAVQGSLSTESGIQCLRHTFQEKLPTPGGVGWCRQQCRAAHQLNPRSSRSGILVKRSFQCLVVWDGAGSSAGQPINSIADPVGQA